MKKVVFLDRDGTINKEVGYLHKKEDLVFIPRAAQAIHLLNRNGFLVVVVTNQAGVAKGYYKEEDILQLHRYMQEELRKVDAGIDEFCYCPYHIDGKIDRYKKDSEDRKPGIGMFQSIEKKVEIDKANSWMIGDMESDIQAGINFGIHTILVATGYGRKTYEKGKSGFEYYASDLWEAVKIILSETK